MTLYSIQDWQTFLSAFDWETLTLAALALLAAVSLVHLWHKSAKSKSAHLSSTANDPNKNRKSGAWIPVDFQYPSIAACSKEPSEMQPIPYRPFRPGEYHVTMGIRSMPWNEWIELDNQFETYHRIRTHRIRTRGSGVIRVQPETPGLVRSGVEAALELPHELAEYLSRRFPTTYQVVRHPMGTPATYGGWNGAPPIKTIRIVPFNVSYNIPLDINDGSDAPVRALQVAALLVQEDLALMIEGTNGKYYFQAGAILIPGFWRIQDKIGLTLDEIHTTGKVPRYKEKLQMSMERFFQRLSVDKPVVRNNYFFQVVKPPAPKDEEDIDPEELGWAESSHGTEDEFTQQHPAHQPSRPIPTASNIRLRSERQTLRRLPKSGAILFTVRTYLTPIQKLEKEPGVARRLASALRGWGEDIGIYKGRVGGGWWNVLLDYLDTCWDKAAETGDAEELASKESYPF